MSPIERGLEAQVSDGVQRALGRAPRDFAEFVKGRGCGRGVERLTAPQ
ncbi:hypothetical protein [Streptomyces sp. H27-D2]|nr:hypothetical protein [Streptomyces sp. H27-D2]MEC4016002.1 hypothetical protein [Streptomyces sp. H27-D2]